jgi:hypothetical protein
VRRPVMILPRLEPVAAGIPRVVAHGDGLPAAVGRRNAAGDEFVRSGRSEHEQPKEATCAS